MFKFGEPGGRIYSVNKAEMKNFKNFNPQYHPGYLKYTADCGHIVKIQTPPDSKDGHDIDFNIPCACPLCDPLGSVTLDGEPLPDNWYSVE